MITITLIVCLMAGAWFSITLPRVYKASTLILVEPQRVPEAYVRPTVTMRLEDRIRTISQQIMSRTRLKQVIEEFDLYSDLRAKYPTEVVLGTMKKDINLQVKNQRAIELGYMAQDPQVAMRVTSRLASLFIDENLKDREQQARGTSEFLERELERIKRRLETQEQAVKDYKQRYMGELPEQLNANLNQLSRLQEAIQTTDESILAAEQRKLLLQDQLVNRERTEVTVAGDRVVTTNPLQTLLNQLAHYQSRYTDQHPDVIEIKKDIATLTGKLKSQYPEETKSHATTVSGKIDPATIELKNQLADVSGEIARLKAERQRSVKKMSIYQQRVENIPKREQELMSLTRDYNITKENYQSVLDKKIDAQMAENMERRQQGEQFKILDPAELPEKPFKPSWKKIMFLSFILGLGSGVGLAFLLEYADKSFRDQEDMESFLGIPVLASIPLTHTERGLYLARRKKVAYVIVATIIMAGYIAALYYVKSNGITIPLPI